MNRARCALFAFLLVSPAARSDDSRYDQGVAAFDRGDYAAAVEAWRPLAREGDARAQFGLGLIFPLEHAEGLVDAEEALRWLRKAALQGVPAAHNNLALLYAEGHGIAPNPELALYHWREAADAGHAPAMVNLARALDSGFGTPSDPVEAARWYRAAADLGRSDAQRALAALYREGRGVPRDDAEARRLEEAADASESPVSATSTGRAPELDAAAPAIEESEADSEQRVEAPSEAGPDAGSENGSTAATEAPPDRSREHGLYAQLASLRSAEAAAAAATDLQRVHAEALTGLRPTVLPVDLGAKGRWFRVLVGPFEDADRALRLCDSIRAQSRRAACLVIPN